MCGSVSGSVSEAAKDGVNGDGERLEADPEGEKVNTEGFVLRDMNMGVAFDVILPLGLVVIVSMT